MIPHKVYFVIRAYTILCTFAYLDPIQQCFKH